MLRPDSRLSSPSFTMQLAKKSGDDAVGRGSGRNKGRSKCEDLYVYSRSRRRTNESACAGTNSKGSDNAETRNPAKKTKSESQQRNPTSSSYPMYKHPTQKPTTSRSDGVEFSENDETPPPAEEVETTIKIDNGIDDTQTLKVEHPATATADPAGSHLATPPPLSYQLQQTQSKLQNIVDLVMWKDVSRTAFVFGFGSFLLISSSLAGDIHFSIISALSYMGLIYLAATFFYRSLNCRQNNDSEESCPEYSFLVGEEDAIWLLHFILPYLNGVIFKLQALFSGDPETTFKLGLILFVLARCGNSITTWDMVKLGFFGVFSLPKVCSLYSTELIKYGKFWKRRFEDAWDSCSNKKVVFVVVFTLIWNLSSITARMWAVFMLVVVVRYYQQPLCLPKEDCREQHPDVCGGSTEITIN